MKRRPFLPLLALCAIACNPQVEGGPSTPNCTVDAELPLGELQAQVDDASWSNTQTNGFLEEDVGLIVPFTVDASNTVTFRLDTTSTFSVDADGEVDAEEGQDVNDLFEVGAGPLEFSIKTASSSGADATLYVDGTAYHSRDGSDGGYLKLSEVEEDATEGRVIRGCFFFDAGPTTGSGSDVEVTSGVFAIAESDAS